MEARAQGDHHCQGNSCNGSDGDISIGGTTVDVGGSSVDIAGDRAYAVGGSSFDVDINQCMASKAMNIVVVGWQSLVENPTCIADGLDARGNHEAAATVRCTHVDTIRNSFSDFETCKTAVTMIASVRLPTEPQGSSRDDDEDDDHGHDYEALQQQLAALVEDKAKTDQRAARYAAQQREAKQDDRLYAQQLIEEIRQIEEPPSDH